MCGILGTLPVIEETIFKRALDTITHRGPDDYGINNIDNHILLGHRRLSIVDLSDHGHQPMQDFSKRYSIVFNGEIYNFLEIKKELVNLGFVFQSTSDTEVLLNAYIQWGKSCVQRFNGMWAFAIWDKKTKELFLSRDRFGKKPLFYAQIKGRLVFASEMKAIYPFLEKISPSKNFEWMRDNIFLYESTEHCLIDGIKRFPAGHNGFYSKGSMKLARYWNTLDNLVEVPKSYEDQVKEFRSLFVDACKIRMRSDVPMGTALSGGLDSSATISTMSHIAANYTGYEKKDWQHAFVASFPGTAMDESYYAGLASEHIGVNATYVNIDPLKQWDKLDHYLYMFEELYLTSPIPMVMTYEAVKKNGISVTIDGHGADELFSGYGHILEALWDSGLNINKIQDILNIHQDSLGNLPQTRKKTDFELYSKFMIKKILKKLLGKGQNSLDSKHQNFRNLDNFSQELYVIFHGTILPTLLRNYDRYSMMNSVEIRMPFMDHRIVSYVNSLPYSSKFGQGYTKKLIRDAMDPFMPKEITWRKSKIGFNSPIVDWMQNELRDWFGDTVNSKGFLESSLITDTRALKMSIEKIINKEDSDFSHAEKAWTDLSPYLWEKAILKRNHI